MEPVADTNFLFLPINNFLHALTSLSELIAEGN